MLGVLTPACAKKIARRLAATVPHRYTLSSDPGKRTGRIFVDYLWNGRGTTATGAWSPRARTGFPIAAPVSRHQVENGIRPDAFTTRSRRADSPRQVACLTSPTWSALSSSGGVACTDAAASSEPAAATRSPEQCALAKLA